MKERNDKAEDRLEVMLRRWGAEESAGRTDVPPAPAAPAPIAWWSALLRWGLPAAAAAVLLVAAGLFFATATRDFAPAQRAAAPQAPHEDVENLKAELARTRADLQDARAELARSADRQTREIEQLNAQIAALKRNFKKDKEDILAGVNDRIVALNHAIGEKDAQLREYVEKLQEAEKQRSAMGERLVVLTRKHDVVKAELAAAASELARLDNAYRQADAGKQKVQAELAAVKARYEAHLSDLQQAYLAAASGQSARSVSAPPMPPGRYVSMDMRQRAARGAGLLARCAELRPSAWLTSTRRLMDRLEVALTRLNLLNPTDASEAEAFVALIRAGGLVRRIDEVLAGGREDRDVRTWLLEARFVLAGAEHLG